MSTFELLSFILTLTTLMNITFCQNVTYPQPGIGPCVCDLTPRTCDIGCCCDSDCTDADIRAFITACQPYPFQDIQTCVPSYLLFRYNTPDKVNTTNPSSVCFYRDSFTSRNSYTAPILVSNSTETKTISSVYTGYVFPIYANALEALNVPLYKDDSSIMIFFYTNTLGYLSLPLLGPSNECGDEMYVKFYENRSVSCSRSVVSLTTTCLTNEFLNVSNYISTFKVVAQPGIFDLLLNRTVDSFGNVTEPFLYNATGLLTITISSQTCETGGVCNLTTLVPELNSTANQCNNVLKSLTYIITFDGINGIESVTAAVVLGSLATSASSFTQTLAVTSLLKNATAGSPRSGNPGYIVGKPVLAGRVSNTSNTIVTTGPPSSQLTVASGGTCSTSTERTTVTFGYSVLSGCLITIRNNVSAACSTLESTILQYIEGTSFPTRIATFGNSQASNADDWVTISTSGRSLQGYPTSFPSGCRQIIIGSELTIITSQVGSVTNPQSRIIGAEMKYIRGDIRFTCSDPACTNNPQSVPITMTVSFIDSSVTGGPQESTDPLYLTQFKSDLLYAFGVENFAYL